MAEERQKRRPSRGMVAEQQTTSTTTSLAEQKWIDEIQLGLERARMEKKTVRVHATGHSHSYHSPLFDADVIVNPPQETDPPSLQQDASGRYWLTAAATSSLASLRDFLAPYNLRLYGTPEAPTISLGGAVVFGAHSGSGLYLPLAEYVSDMWLVSGQGQLMRLTDKTLFVHYGFLGIVFRIRIEVFPAKPVSWTHLPVKTIEDAMAAISDNTHSLKFGPYSDGIQVTNIAFVANQLPSAEKEEQKDVKRRKSWQALMTPFGQGKIGTKLTQTLIKELPVIGKFASEYYLDEPNVVRAPMDYFEKIPRASVYTIEYALDRSRLPIAYQRLSQLLHTYADKKLDTFVLRFWCRFQPATFTIPSLATYNRPTVYVEITLSDTQAHAREMAERISRILFQLGGRPHLGKTVLYPWLTRHYDLSTLKAAIPLFDPDKLFQNVFAQAMLIGGISPPPPPLPRPPPPVA